jgi:hypothetical protein
MLRKSYLCAAVLLLHAAAWAQDPKQALQEKLAAVKQSIAENQARLRT